MPPECAPRKWNHVELPQVLGRARESDTVSRVSSRPVIIQTEPLAQAAEAWIGERAQVVRAAPSTPEFKTAAQGAQGLVVRTATRVDEELLRQLPTLRVVGRAGVGIESIDQDACGARGVTVVHTPDANTQAVVEFVVGLLSDALRPRPRLERAVNATEWERLRTQAVGATQWNELQVGVLGLGRIGSRVAEVTRAMGCRVRYTDLREIPPTGRHGAEPTPVEALFEMSDVITVHVDGRASNRGFVGSALLDRMKPTATLVNTSRGLVVDTTALAAILRQRPGMRALLDVHEPEPFAAEYPLLGLSNAWLTPHLASRTTTAMEAMSWVVRDVWEVIEGREPRWPAPRP